MKHPSWACVLVLALGTAPVGCAIAPARPPAVSRPGPESAAETDEPFDPFAQAPPELGRTDAEHLAPDPLEPVNRFFFQVNDRLYFWVLEPAARFYADTVPQPARVGIRNFFSNLRTPVRLTACLAQGKFEKAGDEFARFLVNTTIGVAGFGDPAREKYHLEPSREDFGQVLGHYGLRPGFYICWPILGPSSLRDSAGALADGLLDPVSYVPSYPAELGIRAMEAVNSASLHLGEYERLKETALDPYAALRDAYLQRRRHVVEDGEEDDQRAE